MPPKPLFRMPNRPPVMAKPSLSTAPKAPPRARPTPTHHAAPFQPTPQSSPPRWYYAYRPRVSSATFLGYGLLTACACIWVRDHHLVVERVDGSSMAPTISPTVHETGKVDWIITRPYSERPRKDDASGLQRNDVVTFWKPHAPEEIAVKRIVAIEGDTVYPKRGYALDLDAYKDRVSGLPDGLPVTDPDSITAGANTLGKIVVPYGHVWVEGDNHRKSWDSNDFGPISKGLIMGKAIWVWRDWFKFKAMGDERVISEDKMRSRIVEGKTEVPAVFLE